VEPTSGVVSVDGRDVRRAEPAELRRTMGYVIQHGGLFPHRTVVDNIATVPRLLGRSRAAARARSEELMALVGLDPALGRRYPHQLSGGQQQRVGVARALAADPPILLMDEPFSAVDPVVRGELQQELLKLQGQLKKTIVFVTHDIDEAVKLGDRIAVMAVGGRLIQFDAPERVLAAPIEPFVERFLGVDRGVRWLSFVPATAITLRPALTDRSDGAPAVADECPGVADEPPAMTDGPPAMTDEPPAVSDDRPRASEWVLVVDDTGRPQGWRHGPAGSAVRPLGHTFRPATDSVRAALDAVVLSPAGMAVAVDESGVVTGVAGYDDIQKAIIDAGGRP
jgi:osmoprotectant transport system ATP-binding protein